MSKHGTLMHGAAAAAATLEARPIQSER